MAEIAERENIASATSSTWCGCRLNKSNCSLQEIPKPANPPGD
jgi:hypothetical protein